jgi:hypothetical protein
VKALPDDSVAPKTTLLEAIDNIKETQAQIAQINAQAQLMQQRAQQFLMEDPEGQASQIAEAQMQLQGQQELPGEAEVDAAEEEIIEDNPDDN